MTRAGGNGSGESKQNRRTRFLQEETYSATREPIDSAHTLNPDANWKLIAENFMEYYHLPWVHPELNTVSSFGNHERFQGPGLYTGMCTTPMARNPALPIDLDVLPAMPGLTAKDAEPAYWILIVPNLPRFLLPHPL